MKVILSPEYVKKGLALAVPGAYWEPNVGWVVDDPGPKAAAYAVALFPEVLMAHPKLGELRDQLYGSARPDDFATAYNVKLAWGLQGIVPFDYQALDTGYIAAQLRAIGGGFLGWDRGLGKTAASLAIAAELPAKRILVVCGNTMKQTVWGDEIARLWPDAEVRVIPNEKKKREEFIAEELQYARARPAHPVITIVHYEAMAIIAGDKGKGRGWDALGLWDLMIFDESHRLANTKTQMHRATKKARAHANVCLLLTGTAIMNRADDLFGQLNIVFPKTYKAKWKNWNDRYLEHVRTEYGLVCVGFKPEALPKMRKELGVFMVYRTKKAVLKDLPDRTEETRFVDLAPKQRKAYDEVRDQFWTQLESGEELSAANPLAQLNLLRRIATGLSATESRVDDSAKLDFTMELIDDNPEEAYVVFSWYKAPLYALAERLAKKGEGYHVITGDTKHSERSAAVEAFQGGSGRVFLGTLSTLGESVNLQRASSAVFLDRAWNPAVNAQAADRIYRIGQKRNVTVTHVVARNTVDELRVQPVLASKKAIARAVFGAE